MKQIQEATDICKQMGKNMKFRPFIMKMAVDDTGRRMSVANVKAEDMINAKTVEDVSIQVENLDKGATLVWSLQQFEDKLEMMRDALSTFEEQEAAKAKAEEKKELEVQKAAVTSDIFAVDVDDYDFDKDFDIKTAVDLETAFSDFGDIKKAAEAGSGRSRGTVMPRRRQAPA